MQKLIDTVNSYYASGIQSQAKIFKVPSGQYLDRVIAIYPKTPNQLVYVWADPPYESWSDPVEIVADSADYPCSAYMDSNGSIYLVYTQQATLTLLELKMTFSQGSWSWRLSIPCAMGDKIITPASSKIHLIDCGFPGLITIQWRKDILCT
jgi:hypothetical protein